MFLSPFLSQLHGQDAFQAVIQLALPLVVIPADGSEINDGRSAEEEEKKEDKEDAAEKKRNEKSEGVRRKVKVTNLSPLLGVKRRWYGFEEGEDLSDFKQRENRKCTRQSYNLIPLMKNILIECSERQSKKL
ncbi:hypothetical protein CEXT_596691 [Caerostris extrusa]|uniref:Uncharacterized protein n=1 Tax=Caerostris extrusa TaxID=172846 RepID=A0AAV4R673_CAEEX|nr:hypothetical protein CEXT_596691 [Caerostris extrusa]